MSSSSFPESSQTAAPKQDRGPHAEQVVAGQFWTGQAGPGRPDCKLGRGGKAAAGVDGGGEPLQLQQWQQRDKCDIHQSSRHGISPAAGSRSAAVDGAPHMRWPGGRGGRCGQPINEDQLYHRRSRELSEGWAVNGARGGGGGAPPTAVHRRGGAHGGPGKKNQVGDVNSRGPVNQRVRAGCWVIGRREFSGGITEGIMKAQRRRSRFIE